MHFFVRPLVRRRLGTACLLPTALAWVAFAWGSATTAAAQDAPRSYEAPFVDRPVVVDGRLDESAWSAAPWIDRFVDIRGGDFPEPYLSTRVKFVWDDRYLYVGAELEEPHLWATYDERDAIVYHENDFEVFLDPDGDGEAYYELEINALGTEFDLFLDKPYRDGGSAHIEWDMPGLLTAVHLRGTLNDPTDTDGGWSVEIAIPWADLAAPDSVEVTGVRHTTVPRPGDEWRVNMSRVEWPLVVRDGVYAKEREPENWQDHPEHNWVWSPQGIINMHAPETWGVLRFTRGSG